MRGHWLFKSEPSEYSLQELREDGRAGWDGVRNYQARNFMRDQMKVGDWVIFYHSNAQPSAAVGLAQVVREAHPDPTQFDPSSRYYDPKATPQRPRWWQVEIAFVEAFERPVPIARMRQEPELRDMILLRRGSRLSIVPLQRWHFECIVRLGGLDPARYPEV